ncbi:hypothetical protein Zmor_014381 [Zophobas morio]|uniref:Uncharacterized protein n=1 Tax=Zophobas morio TaxID=2755281 RepID=A0AA38IF29_9CUCU|nr:hypothetical protein Zmor_014381 [Zophobas morio]
MLQNENPSKHTHGTRNEIYWSQRSHAQARTQPHKSKADLPHPYRRCDPASKGQQNPPRLKRLTTWRIQTLNQRMHCCKMKTQASTPMELGTKSIGRSAHTPKGERSRIDTGPTDLILLG